MAKISIGSSVVITPKRKKTSQGNNMAMIKKSSMNKNQKRSFKKYRGQGS
jgi:hypothetical protein